MSKKSPTFLNLAAPVASVVNIDQLNVDVDSRRHPRGLMMSTDAGRVWRVIAGDFTAIT